METKVCTRCGKELPITEFRPKAKHKVCRMAWCKKCVQEYQRERYRTNPEYRESSQRSNRECARRRAGK